MAGQSYGLAAERTLRYESSMVNTACSPKSNGGGCFIMLRGKLRRRLLAAACIVLGTSSAIAFVIAKTIYAADKNGHGYIHSIETNAELTDALETLGVTTISFGLKCPPGH